MLTRGFFAAILMGFITCSPSLVMASDYLPYNFEAQNMQNAVQVALTPQGQKYFANNLRQVLGNLGLNLSEGYFNSTEYVSSKNVDLDELEKKYPEPAQLLKQVRQLLTQWLVGFSLKDHRPAFRIGQSEYSAEISRMALLTDQKIMDQLNRTEGAVLVFELEIKKLTSKFARASVWDYNNANLGELGMTDVTLTLGDSQTPLFLRLPFYVSLNSQQELNFEALGFHHNLNTVPLDIRYAHLIVPQLVVELNGVKYPLNNQELEATVERQMPDLLMKAREYIAQYAQSDLPKKLNELAKLHLKGQIEEVEYLVPPSLPESENIPGRDLNEYAFLWGLKLKSFRQKNHLFINFDAFLEDPKSFQTVKISKDSAARGSVDLTLEKTPHDVAVSVDRAVINRALQLSALRGYFEKIAMDDGTELKLQGIPTIDALKSHKGLETSDLVTYAKIRINVEERPNSAFLEDVIVVSFDVIAKLVPAEDGEGMEILLYDVDLDSVYMDKRYYAGLGNLFKGQVMKGIKAEIAKKSQLWKKERTSLNAKMDLPPAVLGQKLEIKKLHFDPSGQFVMYLNFQRPSATKQQLAKSKVQR